MNEEGRVGILMCAGCAFVCLLLFVSIALTEVAMQDRRLVSCADALASAAVAGASASDIFAGNDLGVSEDAAHSRVDRALALLADSTCRVGDGVSVTWVDVANDEVEVGVRARPSVSLLPPVLRAAAVPQLQRTSSARLRSAQRAG